MSFSQIFAQASRAKLLPVTKQDYEQWLDNQWLFDKLSGLTIGQSFCQYFGSEDYYLEKFKSEQLAKEWISNNYLT